MTDTNKKRAYGMKGAKKKDVYLDPESIEKALKLGHGNLSAGIRFALKWLPLNENNEAENTNGAL